MKKDIAIIGAGVGGCMAALAAAKEGMRVIMTEECKWIGGQLTAQAVPPDEHPWIEEFGCTRTYREYRDRVREYYRSNYRLTAEARNDCQLNPGNAWVSRIAHEPKVAMRILSDMLQPYISNGSIEILMEHRIRSAQVKADRIETVTVINLENNTPVEIEAAVFLDATELGDVLPLAGAEYAVGAESKTDTGEYHAMEQEMRDDVQSFTHVFAVEFAAGESHVIEKPEQYEYWRSYQAPFLDHLQFSEYIPEAATGESKHIPLFPEGERLSLWDYRRIIDKDLFEKGFFKGDISLINWPQNDYWGGSIIDVTEEEKEKHLHAAKQLSLSLLYWLQTEAPRGGRTKGYPELKLRPDITGTADGFAMHPYIRESRRIKAIETVVEEDINADLRGQKGIRKRVNSVGIGAYRIDLHPTTKSNRLFYTPSFPFEIPLGSLIPIRIRNLVPSCKNIGSTQITNGCIRVHPVEWAIGEAAGTLAAIAIRKNMNLQEIHGDSAAVTELQQTLRMNGVPLHWPEIDKI